MIDFSEKYNREEILKFLQNNFLKDFQKDVRKVNVPEGKFIKSAFSLGSSKDLELGVFEFEHTGSTEKKVTLTKEAFKILRDSGYFKALAFFHSEDTDDWRFSLMTITPTLTEKGKIKKEFSNPKRFSFLLGPRAKVNTPTQFLIKKGQIESLEDLKERFSIEVVNKEFYKKISELFVELVGGELGTGRSKVKYEGLLELPGVKPASKEAQEFAVRLIGRLIFCWFLREKKNGSEDSLMPSSLLSYEASKENNDYYHEVLEPIFFKVLNVPIDSRKEEKYSKDPYGQIPYLNGGLFTPHEDDYYSNIESKQKEYRKVVSVPDEWIQKLFKILETYNFTIDENSSFDEELSIDPEMLGRIFENLLAEINPETGESARKSTGSFYTPRVIVDYMVDESLYLYLQEKTGVKDEKLRALISYDLDDDEDSPLETKEKEKIINAIDELKILDPACGSGAFPMGILQKVVFVLQQLDPDGQLWFKRQIKGVPVELRKTLEQEHKEQNFDYIRKMGVIRKNIFGIDIQPIATEISRLRCFLTLVVDQKVDNTKDNRGIVPLPNLDFKFVTANSLISLPDREENGETMGMFEDQVSIDSLREIREQFFNASDHERGRLKEDFYRKQLDMSRHYNAVKNAGPDITERLLSWDPFSHEGTDWFDPEWMFGIREGFNIVIGNPPYIRQEKIDNKDILENVYEKDVFSGRADIFVYFYSMGINLLGENGILSYISSDKFISRGYAKRLRKFLNETLEILYVLDFGEYPVFKATVETCIFIGRKTNDLKEDHSLYFAEVKNTEMLERMDSFFAVAHPVEQHRLDEGNWIFTDNESFNLLQKLKANAKSLGEYVNNEIYCGVKTGRNNVFIIDQEKYDYFKADPAGVDGLLHKWLVGSDISQWKIDWEPKYLIFCNSEEEFEKNKRIKNYLFKNKETLQSRAAIDKEKYYQLQQPQTGIYQKFYEPKIIYQNVSRHYKFVLDEQGFFPDMNLFIIPSSELYLLGLLTSSTLQFFAHKVTGTEPGGFLVLKTMYVSKFPIPEANSEIRSNVTKLVREIVQTASQNGDVKNLERRLDSMVYEIFDLSENETNLIESFINEHE
jgi:hypothetical protein